MDCTALASFTHPATHVPTEGYFGKIGGIGGRPVNLKSGSLTPVDGSSSALFEPLYERGAYDARIPRSKRDLADLS
jgi:hypothetical protein